MNVRQVRKKIKSVSNVKKITRSMQLVSAIKMRKSQQTAIEARTYQEYLELIIGKVMKKVESVHSDLLVSHAGKVAKKLVIVITTNKGLCGSFNVELFRYMVKNVSREDADCVVVGKKGSQFLTKSGYSVVADYSSSHMIDSASPIISFVLSAFLAGTYRSVEIVYNRFISTLKTEPEAAQILPFQLPEKAKQVAESAGSEYLIEPDPQTIVEQVLRSFVEEKVRNALIQSEAGEHSSRMIAMKNATDNANEVVYNLSLLSNKLRQEKITGELLDMITAKESVDG